LFQLLTESRIKHLIQPAGAQGDVGAFLMQGHFINPDGIDRFLEAGGRVLRYPLAHLAHGEQFLFANRVSFYLGHISCMTAEIGGIGQNSLKGALHCLVKGSFSLVARCISQA
jgi:hypothetical protein